MSDIWPTAFVNVICNCELIEDVSNSIGKDFADQLCTLHYELKGKCRFVSDVSFSANCKTSFPRFDPKCPNPFVLPNEPAMLITIKAPLQDKSDHSYPHGYGLTEGDIQTVASNVKSFFTSSQIGINNENIFAIPETFNLILQQKIMK